MTGEFFYNKSLRYFLSSLVPSFSTIGPPVLEKKIFEGFLPYMGVAAILLL